MSSPYPNPSLPLTIKQATLIVVDSGATLVPDPVTRIPQPRGRWTLGQLEALSIVWRGMMDLRLRQKNDPRTCSYLHTADTEEIAALEGTEKLMQLGRSHGGWAVPAGEWTLRELETLCSLLRSQAHPSRDGIDELVQMVVDQRRIGQGESTSSEEMCQLAELLTAGINPGGFPEIFERFRTHLAKGLSLPRIVCAANVYVVRDPAGQVRKHVLPAPRHGGRLMSDLMGLIGLSLSNRDPAVLDPYITTEQGFIDQHDNFYTREQAWVIAEYHNQIVRPAHWEVGVLCSENLY